jgi:hypothetical protein
MVHGAILVYKLQPEFGLMTIKEKPLNMCILDCGSKRIVSLNMLPAELICSQEDEDPSTDDHTQRESHAQSAQIVVATSSGEVRVIELTSLKVKAIIKPSEGSKFLSACYCAGMGISLMSCFYLQIISS